MGGLLYARDFGEHRRMLKRWIGVAVVGFVGFGAGWIASQRSTAPEFKRCHAGLNYLMKRARDDDALNAIRLMQTGPAPD